MARCKMSGTGPQFGNNVSHANNKTRRRWQPNVQTKRIWLEKEQRWVRVKVSARTLRTISKIGFEAYARKVGYEY